MQEITRDLIYNMNAFRMWISKKPDNTRVVGTPEQALNEMYNENTDIKLTESDRIDIYMLLHNSYYLDNDDNYDYEKGLTCKSSILDYYNISEICLYNAMKWVKKNRSDIVELCDNQVDLFGDIEVKTVDIIKPKQPKRTSRVKRSPRKSIMDQVDMLEFMVM